MNALQIILLILLFISITLGVLAVAVIFTRGSTLRSRLKALMQGREVVGEIDIESAASPWANSMFRAVIDPMSRLAAPDKEEEISRFRERFIRAGLRDSNAPLWFFATKAVLALIVPLAVLLLVQIWAPKTSGLTSLLLAFIGGFFWDAQCALGPHGGDPSVYTQQVENLRFGYSVLLFGGMGVLMQGIQPLFKQGKWHFSALLSGIAVLLYLAAEYTIINFVRGGIVINRATLLQMLSTAILTMLFSPLVFWLLFRTAALFHHSINPEAGRRRRRLA